MGRPATTTQKSAAVARELRDQITGGTLGPGESLPSENQLATTHGVSRYAVRQAIARLAAEGLVISEDKRGTFVRVRRERPRYTDTRTLTQHESRLSDSDTDMWQTVEATTTRVNATDDLALALGVAERTPIIVYDRLLTADEGKRRMIHRLYVPITTATQLPTLTETPGPPAQVYALLVDAGHELRWTETVRITMPTPDDTTRLKLETSEQILITRRLTVGNGHRPLVMEETRRTSTDTQLTYTITPTTPEDLASDQAACSV